ncbi:NlpC/P60 family protein [Kutzneria sp. NPDC052558]|uniref:NlpC/P60 family protein n=1 Tax=Kutzneria sp. NPDC052558 TaxID=3364121 RepID=UPI0037C64997
MKYIRTAVLLTTLVVSGTAVVYLAQSSEAPAFARDSGVVVATRAVRPPATSYSFLRLDNPPRTEVLDQDNGLVATFTDGARSAVLNGPNRTFSDPARTPAVVTTDAWVRFTDQPWHAGDEKAEWFRPWLTHALADSGPDLLAVATQYVASARFGPDADVADFLGEPWQGRTPRKTKLGTLDSAGYARLVYGYRMGYPAIPRNPAEIATASLGAVVADQAPGAARAKFLAQPGDLLLFAIDGKEIDHVGIYLGADDSGRPRFLACRGSGPTFSDVLDDNGPYATGLRGIRRL